MSIQIGPHFVKIYLTKRYGLISGGAGTNEQAVAGRQGADTGRVFQCARQTTGGFPGELVNIQMKSCELETILDKSLRQNDKTMLLKC